MFSRFLKGGFFCLFLLSFPGAAALAQNIDVTWTGAISTSWDVNSTANWTGPSPPLNKVFVHGDVVFFDDVNTQSGNYGINIVPGEVRTGGMHVGGAQNFTFSGGSIKVNSSYFTGSDPTNATGKLTKSGSGTLTLNTANELYGGVVLGGGSIILGNDLALDTWVSGANPNSTSRGMVLVNGNSGAIGVNADREITNRFEVQNGSLAFDIATGSTLTISGVDVIGKSGSAFYLNASTVSSTVSFQGGNLVLTGNTSNFSGGLLSGIAAGTGGSYDFSNLESLSVTGNQSQDTGGFLYLTSSGTGGSSNLFLPGRTWISGNNAGDGGGAIYIHSADSANISIQGNTLFENNTVGSSDGAGAIHIGSTNDSTGGGTLSLDTTLGHIAFRNNEYSGNSGSIRLDANTAMVITGDHHVYIDDLLLPPQSAASGGNSLTLNGSGIVQFGGTANHILNNSGMAGGAVNVNSGTFRIVAGAGFQALGNDAVFTLANGANLSGGGEITAQQGFQLSGTVSPDTAVWAVPDFDDSTNTFGAADTDIPDAQKIGTMTLIGASVFNGATLKIDLDAGNASDTIIVQGNVSFGANNTVDLNNFLEGTFDLIDATGSTMDAITGMFNAVTLNGNVLGHRQVAMLLKTGEILQLKTNVNNINLLWKSLQNNVWDVAATENWWDASDLPDEFIDGDRVTFDGTATDRNVTLNVDVTVADMIVTGANDHLIDGTGSITARDYVSGTTTLTDATGKLQKSGTGTLTLNMGNEFYGGIELDGGTIILGHDTALGIWDSATGDASVSRQGLVTVGGNAEIQADVDRAITNRFLVESGGSLLFDIAQNETLTITNVQNKATGGLGGAIEVSNTGTLGFDTAGNFVLSDNSAASGGGVGMQNGSVSLDFSPLDAFWVDGNTADTNGGGIYARSNSATASVSVGGNAYFHANVAATSGGAIFIDSALAGGTLNLNADSGHIVFSENTAKGVSNAIQLERNTILTIDGANHVYLNDPVGSGVSGGNGLLKSGTGIVQWTGDSVLNSGGSGGTVRIDAGTFRVTNGSSFSTSGTDATFSLVGGATLTGGGTITATQGFTLGGTIAPDNATLSAPTWNTATNRFGTADTSIPDAQKIGTVTLVGASEFNGAMLKIDLGSGNLSDTVNVQGNVAFGGTKNSVDIATYEIGTYDLIVVTSGGSMQDISADVYEKFNAVTVGGLAPGGRQSAVLEQHDDIIRLVTSSLNLDLTWTGNTDNVWNTTNVVNWKDNLDNPETFNIRDYVIFDSAGIAENVISVGDGTSSTTVQVSGMEVRDSYTFNGGGIRGIASTSHIQTSTGRIDIAGTGTIATFNNSILFDNGMTISTGAAAKIGDSGSLSDMDVVNDGNLTFDKNIGHDQTFAGNISGSGSFTKTGTGAVTLTGTNTYSGGTTVSAGSLLGDTDSLQGNLFIDSGAEAVFQQAGNDGTYTGVLTGSGDLRKTGNAVLTLSNDSATFDGDIQVRSGTLALLDNKHLGASGVSVDSSASLILGANSVIGGPLTADVNSTFQSGNGAIIDGNATFAGTVLVGKTLTVNGDLALNNGAGYHVNLVANPGEESATNITADNITIDPGSNMTVNDTGVLTDYIGSRPITFTVLKSLYGITGDFGNVTGFSSLFEVAYGVEGLNYVITVKLDETDPFLKYAKNHNMREVAKALNKGIGDPDMKDLLDSFSGKTDAEIFDMIDQLRGSELAAAAQTFVLSSPWIKVFRNVDTVDHPEHDFAFECNPSRAIHGQSEKTDRNRIWFDGYYRYLDTRTDHNARDYLERRGGLMTGVDTDLTRRVRFGAAFGYSRPEISSVFGDVTADDFIFSLYSRIRLPRRIDANLFVGYGLLDYDYTRYEMRRNRYTARFKGHAAYSSLELRRPFRYHDFGTLLPLLAIDYQQGWMDGFEEQGGLFPQVIDDASSKRLTVRTGLVSRFYRNNRMNLTSRLQYAFLVHGDEYTNADARFMISQNSSTMYLRGVNIGRHQFTAGLGLEYWWNTRTTFFTNYDFDCTDRTCAHTGQFGVVIKR